MQLELADSAKKVMVVNTPKGLMQYLRMPYGIKPASSIFQSVMDTLLGNISMVGIRTDDILISGRTDAEHLQNLEKVVCKLSDVGITIRKEKCNFFMSEGENLGHIIDKYGIRVNPSKTDALRNARKPKNVKELQSFIGGVSYYSKFIPDMATITKPLYLLLQKNMNWEWGDEQKHAFAILKTKLIRPPVLTIYDGKLELKLDCDASMYGLGVVLSHVYPDGNERPIAYASRSLNKHELNYSQIDKEALGIIFGVKKFNQYLYGRHFTLMPRQKLTRHKLTQTKARRQKLTRQKLTRQKLTRQKLTQTKTHSHKQISRLYILSVAVCALGLIRGGLNIGVGYDDYKLGGHISVRQME